MSNPLFLIKTSLNSCPQIKEFEAIWISSITEFPTFKLLSRVVNGFLLFAVLSHNDSLAISTDF